MTSRREHERRGGDRDNYPRREPVREPVKAAPRPRLNEYWIDGEGITREVLQTEICRFLGAEATCRPGDYNGRRGYKIKAQRPFTPEMLEDLRTASRAYQSESSYMQAQGQEEIPYEYSDTNRARAGGMQPGDSRYGSTGYEHPGGTSYPMESGPGYPAPSPYSTGVGFPPGGYPVVTAPGSMSGYSTMSGDGSRYSAPNYTHERPANGAYNTQDNYYPQGSPYGNQPPRELGSGGMYRGPSGSDMLSGRGVPMDDPSRYYESMPPTTSAPGPYSGAPYRGQPSPYDPHAAPSRDGYSTRPGAPSSDPYRRR